MLVTLILAMNNGFRTDPILRREFNIVNRDYLINRRWINSFSSDTLLSLFEFKDIITEIFKLIIVVYVQSPVFNVLHTNLVIIIAQFLKNIRDVVLISRVLNSPIDLKNEPVLAPHVREEVSQDPWMTC